MRRMPEPFAMVIFGASGDLTRRKLFPALFNLHAESVIPENTAVVGTSRTEYSRAEFIAEMRAATEERSRIRPTTQAWDAFAAYVYYEPGDATGPDLYERLKERLEELDAQHGTAGNRLWYLATLPEFFSVIPEQLGKGGLFDTGGRHRLVVEKPFGHDLASARELNAALSRSLTEDQIFRIDHYLGKETVQNLLVFRFA